MTDSTDGTGTTSSPDDGTLEVRLGRLEEIVRTLEVEEPDLERALALFEEGVGHVRHAEELLAKAELRVEELLGEKEVRPFGEGSE
jgi:exodeoxyribonuclease VII small subunit